MANTPVEIAQDVRVEIGAWVETSTPKKYGSGMRKAWVAPVPKGADARLSVIVGNTHAITLHVGTDAQRAQAREMLTLALAGLDALDKAPKAEAPKSSRKAPTPPPAAPKAPASTTRNPAPQPAPVLDGADWFRDLMHSAGAV